MSSEWTPRERRLGPQLRCQATYPEWYPSWDMITLVFKRVLMSNDGSLLFIVMVHKLLVDSWYIDYTRCGLVDSDMAA